MTGLSARAIFALVTLLACIGLGVFLARGWWAPQLNAAIDKLLKSEDRAASAQIEAAGAEETTAAVEQHAQTQIQTQTRTHYVTRRIRAAPDASTPLPRGDADLLRASDDELCKLAVACSSEEGVSAAGGPAPTPDASERKPAVRPVRPAERGDADLR